MLSSRLQPTGLQPRARHTSSPALGSLSVRATPRAHAIVLAHCLLLLCPTAFAIFGGLFTGYIMSLFPSPVPAYDDDLFWEVPKGGALPPEEELPDDAKHATTAL